MTEGIDIWRSAKLLVDQRWADRDEHKAALLKKAVLQRALRNERRIGDEAERSARLAELPTIDPGRPVPPRSGRRFPARDLGATRPR